MKCAKTEFAGVLLFELDSFADDRGSFMELWNGPKYAELGLRQGFVQDNISHSGVGVIRGLHFQWPNPQGKLVAVLRGVIWDVVVDVRPDSPEFGKWLGFELSSANRRQLYIPPGFAHGFVVPSEPSIVLYKCTAPYCAAADRTVAWNDPQIGVEWPVQNPVLSSKDRGAKRLSDFLADELPTVSATRQSGGER